MKFLSVKDLRTKSSQIWRELPSEQEMVITNNGRPVAILSAIDDTNFEESLAAIRQARAAEALAAIHRKSIARGLEKMKSHEIDQEITAVRKNRSL